ncbi:hypothetical protein ACFU6R_34955 [Streptomyces sp. NPDC057499]|uniref:hypothetical protein n=1 Tax=Streptomyces sp. NPDC057499 TaxID=3346150 RepID=UPI00367D3A28
MHRIARTGTVLAAGLLASLALTGCGGDSGKNDAPGGDGSAGTEQSGAPSGGGSGETGGSGGSGTDATALEGGWAGRTDGKAVVLSVSAGKVALVTEQRACTGTVQGSGKVTLTLKCVDGGDDRTSGSVESNDGKTLVVSWDSGVRDTLAKTAAGALPSGLPDLGDLPTS